MSVPSTRPRVFISSTIYDFKDLRSAIKFWLEDMGYEVNASEFNDFKKELDKNSFEACLKTIDESQYFILLIGARAGGWYDEPNKITITLQEYRRAYEGVKRGTLKIFTFVRRSVWDVREDRRALNRFLTEEYGIEHGLSTDEVNTIKNHRSRVIVDAEVIFGFLSEVARSAEMDAAAAGTGAAPVGNWIYRFETFRDVVDALRVGFARSGSLRKAALISSLRIELVNNLIHMFRRSEEGRIMPVCQWASYARSECIGSLMDTTCVTGKYLKRLVLFCLVGYVSSWINTRVIDEAIVSGEFLEYDTTNDRFIAGTIQEALVNLRENIDKLVAFEKDFSVKERSWFSENFGAATRDDINYEVKNVNLIKALCLYDRHYNVIAISAALLKFFDGREYKKPNLFPTSPFEKDAEAVAKETPSKQDILDWVDKLEY